MKRDIPHPPDARQEPGHSRENVRLDPPAPPAAGSTKKKAHAPAAGAEAQADGYTDDVKSPPGNMQDRR